VTVHLERGQATLPNLQICLPNLQICPTCEFAELELLIESLSDLEESISLPLIRGITTSVSMAD